jgi:channel protein (hemolysin III family)
MPSKRFGEGAMLPLLGVLEKNPYIQKLRLSSATMWDGRYRGTGNGNSNARVLATILEKNKIIDEVDLTHTGLDDDGMIEICRALEKNRSVTHLNLSRNTFSERGARALRDSLYNNSSLQYLDLSRNALGFQTISNLQCACNSTGLILDTGGNYVFEEIMNAVSHGIGFMLAIVASTLLMTDAVSKGTDYHYWSASLFSFSLIFLFLCSTLYHSFFMVPSASHVLQILDHVGIYFLIAGSYTPFMLIGLHHSFSAKILLIIEWSIAGVGSIFATCTDLNSPKTNTVECVLFLMMGFAVLIIWEEMRAYLPSECLTLLMCGGCTYALGVSFYVLGEFKPIFHVIWHCNVLVAATLIWFSVYFYVMPIDLPDNKITFQFPKTKEL